MDAHEYQFFGQFQVNAADHGLSGVELLLRENYNGQWRVPRNFDQVPTAVLVDLLLLATRQLGNKVASVSVNFCRQQLLNPELIAGIVQVQRAVWPLRVVVEITETSGAQAVANQELIPVFEQLIAAGIDISMDDVGNDLNQFASVQGILPYIAEFKFALQNYRSVHKQFLMMDELSFWSEVAHHLDRRLIIEGIETHSDVKLAADFRADICQGFYYGQPEAL